MAAPPFGRLPGN